MSSTFFLLLPTVILTGLLPVLSLLSRTRLPAVLAGLSPLLDPLKVLIKLLLVNFSLFLSSSLSIAPRNTVTSVAWAVSWTTLSSMLWILLLILSLTTLTKDGLSVAANSPQKVLLKLPP